MTLVSLQVLDAYWSYSSERVLTLLQTSYQGLSSAEARKRFVQYDKDRIVDGADLGHWSIFLRQFKSPIIILLLVAALLSWGVGSHVDATIIFVIIVASATLTYIREYQAGSAMATLLSLVEGKVTVLRDEKAFALRISRVVPGDVLLLKAGTVIPADGYLLEAQSLFVSEAALTGESFPLEKRPGELPVTTALCERLNTLYLGTHVVSGQGRMVVVCIGKKTEFGHISEQLSLRPPENEFEKSIRHIGYLLIELTLMLTFGVFAVNVYFERPVLESFLFALALAVGLTPQLLPAIIGANLSKGSQELAKVNVIVKRLEAIENFGSMDVLCCDKTGTLTQGLVQVHHAFDVHGHVSGPVLQAAQLNALFQCSFQNPTDTALMQDASSALKNSYKFIREIPYDFTRKRVSVVLESGGVQTLICKGAFEQVIACCKMLHAAADRDEPIALYQEELTRLYADYSTKGYRVLGVASKLVQQEVRDNRSAEEEGMTFLGFLLLEDPIREDIVATVAELHSLGVCLKMITGDNHFVAAHVAGLIGLPSENIITGSALRTLSNEALMQQVQDVDVFAEIEPNQKERLILALKKRGNVVGFLGDGINDCSAIHAADVGISVSSAVDVAKEAADLVMLERGLMVLVAGIKEGRKVFANTLKYIYMATSANFGNMFSMMGASLFPVSMMPFLPLLPKQILLMNVLTDLPEMAIATDEVDPELIEKPRRLDTSALKRFMLLYGSLSSLFDFATFGMLLWLKESERMFQTGWFTESIISASLIVLVIRTRRPFLYSHPSRYLVGATVGVIFATLIVPYTSIGPLLNLEPLSGSILAGVCGIVVLYVAAAECMKLYVSRHTLWM